MGNMPRISMMLRVELALARFLPSVVKKFVPPIVKKLRRRRIFRNVYKRNLWGSSKENPFYSGIGSRGVAADAYIETMARLLNNLSSEMGRKIAVVDLGCGDYEIGRALLARVPAMDYIGCDIVPELIAHHSKEKPDFRARFKVLDIVYDELPAGDVCLIRQVFQHLSNANINAVLAKLYKYTKVYVTEGYPVVPEGPTNPDKSVGFHVRFNSRTGRGRGVELDKDPFGVGTHEVCRALATPQESIATFEIDLTRAKGSQANMERSRTISS
jgi:hypothetical protein